LRGTRRALRLELSLGVAEKFKGILARMFLKSWLLPF
jgi:hypothetical protein